MQQAKRSTDIPPADLDFVPGTLENTIVQVSFPEIAEITGVKTTKPFQDLIRHEYPFMREDRRSGPGDTTIWRYIDLAQKWTVSLCSTSLVIETRHFTSRGELAERLSTVLSALRETFNPPSVQRIGVRHVARGVPSGDMEASPLARAELLGLAGAFPGAHISLNEVHVLTEEGCMTIRHGKLPPGFSSGTDIVPARPETTWFLDVDSYTVTPAGDAVVPFETSTAVLTATALSARAAMAARACGDMNFTHPTALPAAATRH